MSNKWDRFKAASPEACAFAFIVENPDKSDQVEVKVKKMIIILILNDPHKQVAFLNKVQRSGLTAWSHVPQEHSSFRVC